MFSFADMPTYLQPLPHINIHDKLSCRTIPLGRLVVGRLRDCNKLDTDRKNSARGLCLLPALLLLPLLDTAVDVAKLMLQRLLPDCVLRKRQTGGLTENLSLLTKDKRQRWWCDCSHFFALMTRHCSFYGAPTIRLGGGGDGINSNKRKFVFHFVECTPVDCGTF